MLHCDVPYIIHSRYFQFEGILIETFKKKIRKKLQINPSFIKNVEFFGQKFLSTCKPACNFGKPIKISDIATCNIY